MLPSNMLKLVPPVASDLIETLAHAIEHDVKHVVPDDFHSAVCEMYSWHDVAARTEAVYTSAAANPSSIQSLNRIEASDRFGLPLAWVRSFGCVRLAVFVWLCSFGCVRCAGCIGASAVQMVTSVVPTLPSTRWPHSPHRSRHLARRHCSRGSF